MKILHVCLVGAGFNDGWGYQENMLAKYNSINGHQVSVLTSQYIRKSSGDLTKINQTNYYDENNTNIIRLPLKKGSKPDNKFRTFVGVKKVLETIKPEIIFIHNFQFFDLFKVIKYVKNNPNVTLYIDSHTDMNNSANNWVSRNILHKLIYRNFAKRTLKYVKKIFFISYEVEEFLRNIYKIPTSFLEFYPLGGTIISEEEKKRICFKVRKEINVSSEEILFCHSGKMDDKKKTYELIRNFVEIEDDRLRLILIGTFSKIVKEKVMPYINNDKRIIYLGWKDSEELVKYIAASDLYLQPGSQSATMQNALCSGTPVLISDVKAHQVYLKGNAFAIGKLDEIKDVFIKVCEEPAILNEMSKKAFVLARRILDYKKLADRIIE